MPQPVHDPHSRGKPCPAASIATVLIAKDPIERLVPLGIRADRLPSWLPNSSPPSHPHSKAIFFDSKVVTQAEIVTTGRGIGGGHRAVQSGFRSWTHRRYRGCRALAAWRRNQGLFHASFSKLKHRADVNGPQIPAGTRAATRQRARFEKAEARANAKLRPD